MLVLTRKTNQSIKIGNDITIEILSMGGGQARIGITAPLDIPVHREEIYNKIANDIGLRQFEPISKGE